MNIGWEEQRAQNKQIVEDYVNTVPDVSHAHLARKYGLSRERIRQILNKAGVNRANGLAPKSRIYQTPETLRTIADRYAAGEGLAKIAKEFGVDKNTIKYWAQKQGISLLPDNRKGRVSRIIHDSGLQPHLDALSLSRSARVGFAAKILLGSKCIRCGFSDYRALQIDHVNGGGVQDIKTRGTVASAYDIVRGKNLEHYQLLCANCNWIKKYENKEN